MMALTKATYSLIEGAPFNVLDYGAVADGVTDDAAAIQAAIAAAAAAGGGRVRIPAGAYAIGSALTISDNVILVGDGAESTELLRTFTGNFASLGGYAGLENLSINGQTATHGAGIGVTMTGNTPASHMLFVKIFNFVDACLSFGADAGSTFRAIGCTFVTTGTLGTVAAVEVDGTDTAATSRHFTNCESSGCTLFDFGGCNDFYVTGGYTNGLIFSANSTQVMINNVRIGAAAGTTTIAGVSHQIRNCVFAAPVILTCLNAAFHSQAPNYDITDNGTGNDVYIGPLDYTPVFAASGGGAAIGDGTITGRWSREGRKIQFQIDMVFGSTTAVGTGYFTFTLPKTDLGLSTVQIMGTGFAQNSTGANACVFAVRQNTPGDGKVRCIYANTAGQADIVGAASPAAVWGATASIRLSGEYYVP